MRKHIMVVIYLISITFISADVSEGYTIFTRNNAGGGGGGGGSSLNLGDLLGGLGFTSGGMKGFGEMMTGFGGLAKGWGALKDAKLARETLAQQQAQWEKNYESQRLVTNNAIANQNAWKKAQGRTDFGSYVGGKPAGSNYV